MTSKFIGRTGLTRYPECSHCRLPCKHEQYEVSHTFSSKETTVRIYCCLECMKEDMGIEEHIVQVVEDRTRQEFNWLHKQVCPACRRRIIKSV